MAARGHEFYLYFYLYFISLVHSLSSPARDTVIVAANQHSKIKFVFPRGHVISPISLRRRLISFLYNVPTLAPEHKYFSVHGPEKAYFLNICQQNKDLSPVAE